MNKLLKWMLLVLIVAFLYSCKKDDVSPPTKTELITKADWKAVNIEADTVGVFFTVWPLLDACAKDDITTYKADHTYKVVEGASKCDPADPDIFDSGTWQFSGDETLLIQNGSENYKIEELTETSLKVSITDPGSGYKFRFSYGH